MTTNAQTLRQFITEIGDDQAARLFGVKRRTAMSWRLGERRPRPSKAAEIVRALNGRISYEGIYPPPGGQDA